MALMGKKKGLLYTVVNDRVKPAYNGTARDVRVDLSQITNLMHNSFIL